MKNKLSNILFIFVAFVLVLALASCEFKKTTTFKVEFESNGGSLVEEQVVVKGKTATEPSAPEREGYEFLGWFDEALEVKFDFTTPIEEDIKLFGKWELIATSHTVSFVTGTEEVIANQTVAYNTQATKPANPTKQFELFTNWYKDAELTEVYNFSSGVTEDLVLYAGYEKIYVLDIARISSYSEYLQNIKEQDNKQIEFMDRTVPYTVGTLNAWKATPIIYLGTYDADADDFNDVTASWEYELKLQVLVDSEYVDAVVADYVDAFDEATASIDFSDAAENNTFKVVITPKALTEKQLNQLDKYTVSYEVAVVDGFNVYEAKELAYIENRSESNLATSGGITIYGNLWWNEFKEANGLELNFAPETLILHADLDVTADTLPHQMFYSDENLSKSDSDYGRTFGSLIDYTYIYVRESSASESFKLLGNYFNIDCSKVREVQRENNVITPEGGVISHASLFRFEGSGSNEMSNLSITGNAPRTEDTVKAGGVIFVKYDGGVSLAKNMLSFDFFITYMNNANDEEVVIDSCKVYNVYNSFLYNWGGEHFTVKNSEFSSSGGPVLIQDCIHYGTASQMDGQTHFIDCSFDSYVTGQEGWFVSFNATALVGQVKAMDALFNAFGKSFLKTDKDGNTYFNLIVVNKNGDAQGLTSSPVLGGTTFDDCEALDFGEGNVYFQQLLANASSAGAPVFRGCNSTGATGYGYFNGTSLLDIQNNAITDPNNPLFTSQYFGMYYNGMCFIFELFDMGQTYSK